MKDHDLLEAVGGINEKFINNASTVKAKRARRDISNGLQLWHAFVLL